MARKLELTDELADALEAASSFNEDGEVNFTGVSSVTAALGGGLLSLLPMVLTIVTTLVQTLGKGNTLALLKVLPDLFAAVKAGDWNKVIQIITTALGVPMPTPSQVSGSMGPG
jgi:hypothetical protein